MAATEHASLPYLPFDVAITSSAKLSSTIEPVSVLVMVIIAVL